MNAPLSAVLLASGFTLGSILSLVEPTETFESPYQDGTFCLHNYSGTGCFAPGDWAPRYMLDEYGDKIVER